MLKQLSHSAAHKTSEHFINLNGDGLFDHDIILLHISIQKFSIHFKKTLQNALDKVPFKLKLSIMLE